MVGHVEFLVRTVACHGEDLTLNPGDRINNAKESTIQPLASDFKLCNDDWWIN
jgi:hypothetical protein